MPPLIDAVKAQIVNALAGSKDLFSRVTAPARKIEARLVEITPLQEKLLLDLAPPAELLKLHDRIEDVLAVRALEQYGPGIARELPGPVSWTSVDDVTFGQPQIPAAYERPMTYGMWLGFQRLRDWISHLPATTPMADRPAALQALAEEKRLLIAEHAKLCDEAAGAGVAIPHLAETLAARNSARLARERAAQLAADDARNDRLRGH